MGDSFVRRSSRPRRSVTLFDPEEEASKPQLATSSESKKSSSARQRRRSKTPLKQKQSPRSPKSSDQKLKPKRAYTKPETQSRRKRGRPKKRKVSPSRQKGASARSKAASASESNLQVSLFKGDWSRVYEAVIRVVGTVAYFAVSVFAANSVILSVEAKHHNASLTMGVVAVESLVSGICLATGRALKAHEVLREFDRFAAGAMVALTYLSKAVAALYLLDVNYLPFLFCINCFLMARFLPPETQGSITFIDQITAGFLIVYSEWASQLTTRYMGSLAVLAVAVAEFGRDCSKPRHEASHLLFNLAVVFGASPENFHTGPVDLQRFLYEPLVGLVA